MSGCVIAVNESITSKLASQKPVEMNMNPWMNVVDPCNVTKIEPDYFMLSTLQKFNVIFMFTWSSSLGLVKMGYRNVLNCK